MQTPQKQAEIGGGEEWGAARDLERHFEDVGTSRPRPSGRNGRAGARPRIRAVAQTLRYATGTAQRAIRYQGQCADAPPPAEFVFLFWQDGLPVHRVTA